jgi:NADH-quinone oxidoreductase subunit F
MSKLKIEDLAKIKEKMLKGMALRNEGIRAQTAVEIGTPDTVSIDKGVPKSVAKDVKEPGAGKFNLLICGGTGCHSSGSIKIRETLIKELEKRKLSDEVKVIETGCNGFCAQGPVMVVYPGAYFYQLLTPEDMPELIDEHILGGRPVERLMYLDPIEKRPIPKMKDINFFKHQELRVLRNRGLISPEKIEEYIAMDGYRGAAKALKDMTPEDIISEIKNSGLRGRGGAGFLTGVKWELANRSTGDIKYVLCNADEGDPGAFMDRSVLEADPHSVLEGMIIASKAIGSNKGYIYCRAEYPLAITRIGIALDQAKEYGLLGKDIFGTGFDFDIEVCQGAGAFVCGEETALMRSIEGKRGEPRPRPPFPAFKGLWEKPSVLNNVETFSNVPSIICRGADWFRSIGTERSPSTKIFAMTGDVNSVGLVEVEMGTPLGDIIYDIGGGIPNGKKFKAAQIGGPSGGCIPKEHLNVPVDYESLTELGAIMGSGGLIVMDEDTCMVDMARFFLDFVVDESCGKCAPGRIGTKRMLEIVTRICEGKGEEGDIEKLIKLGETIKDTALCGLGQTAPNPVLSTIRYFRDEYEAHIRDKKCPAGICPELVRAPCQNACPAGVDVPGYISLVGEKRYDEAILLHRERNPLTAICARVCFHPCEDKCRRATLDSPVAIRYVKRFMADMDKDFQVPEVRVNEENAKRKIAIIGAGPSGLSCAYFLARLGYKPVIFESESKPGGMLLQGIPAYRLPRDILEREIKTIKDMGVKIKTKTKLGKDITLKGLKDKGYEALFIGVGAPLGSRMRVKGEDIKGVVDGIGFLRQFNMTGKVPVGKKVAVIGGGNAAVDAARTALRLGAESVTIVYRRTREEMPAYKEEIDEAEREGVKIELLLLPKEVVTDEKGKIKGIKVNKMELGQFDKSGRRRPEPIEGSELLIEADQVIAAIGQYLDPKEMLNGVRLKLGGRDYIETNPVTGQTSVEWIFAGGDAVSGPSSVTEAVGLGEKAAVGIDLYLTGEEHAFWREQKESKVPFDPEEEPRDYARVEANLLDVSKRKNNFKEVEIPPGGKALNEKVAICEAKRCLRCDYREEKEAI